MSEINETAQKLVVMGKGILAADESFPTIQKRFANIGLDSTSETRKSYREMLFSTPGIEEFISGVITFDETIRQGLGEILTKKGIILGVKVDLGIENGITQGLPDLDSRLDDYVQLGAKFTKWRMVAKQEYLEINARNIAEFARICQAKGLLPIVEPEVLQEDTQNTGQCKEVTTETLKTVFLELNKAGVDLSGILLKTNMILPGSPDEVARETVEVLKKTVPTTVPGIVFLSGGQPEMMATENLNAINSVGGNPWPLSFSYGRALQNSALKIWSGKPESVVEAQQELYKRSRLNSLATQGKYRREDEI